MLRGDAGGRCHPERRIHPFNLTKPKDVIGMLMIVQAPSGRPAPQAAIWGRRPLPACGHLAGPRLDGRGALPGANRGGTPEGVPVSARVSSWENEGPESSAPSHPPSEVQMAL